MLNIMLPAGDCILSSPSKLREPIHIAERTNWIYAELRLWGRYGPAGRFVMLHSRDDQTRQSSSVHACVFPQATLRASSGHAPVHVPSWTEESLSVNTFSTI
ncbi:uncharacterized protein MCYG_05303 [Microsporum canis CBS 113480]|uniref:Uncharacterized protein n=1 Tax=Arthroderma otae (strain ATCC MYA-4605 / CBS 113480) TaxID=554155 RepID=C5FRI1_ARTOC|nr:uncharacterized protein MCYG_05303 [Microsporum canis CBS 113480]EEQ32484.1 predicted protein [Microsporum canis CBS 113480]